MTIAVKYQSVRDQINNGDIILFRGTHLLARAIHWGDAVKDSSGKWENAYYNHCALVFKKGNRLLTIDSVAQGVDPHFLSKLMRDYIDFCVVRPIGFSEDQIDVAVNKAMDKAEDGIKYDYLMLPRIGLYRRFDLNIKSIGSMNRDTCSEFTGARYAANALGITSYKEVSERQGFITGEDHIRYANNQVQILFDSRIAE